MFGLRVSPSNVLREISSRNLLDVTENLINRGGFATDLEASNNGNRQFFIYFSSNKVYYCNKIHHSMLINIIEDYEIDFTRKNRCYIFGPIQKLISLSNNQSSGGHWLPTD